MPLVLKTTTACVLSALATLSVLAPSAHAQTEPELQTVVISASADASAAGE